MVCTVADGHATYGRVAHSIERHESDYQDLQMIGPPLEALAFLEINLA